MTGSSSPCSTTVLVMLPNAGWLDKATRWRDCKRQVASRLSAAVGKLKLRFYTEKPPAY